MDQEKVSEILGFSKVRSGKGFTDLLKTEEAVKHSLILPLFACLGYDTTNPREFIPEYTSDYGVKNGEKVDYLVEVDNEKRFIVEAKSLKVDLNNYLGQLFRYYSVLDVKYAILTNGLEYRFYADFDKANILDNKPFYRLDLRRLQPEDAEFLLMFSKDDFDKDAMSKNITDKKLATDFRYWLSRQLAEPTDSFIRLLAKEFGVDVDADETEKYRQEIANVFGK